MNVSVDVDIGPCRQRLVVGVRLDQFTLALLVARNLGAQLPEVIRWVRAVGVLETSVVVRGTPGENIGGGNTHEGTDVSEGLHFGWKE